MNVVIMRFYVIEIVNGAQSVEKAYHIIPAHISSKALSVEGAINAPNAHIVCNTTSAGSNVNRRSVTIASQLKSNHKPIINKESMRDRMSTTPAMTDELGTIKIFSMHKITSERF